MKKSLHGKNQSVAIMAVVEHDPFSIGLIENRKETIATLFGSYIGI